MRRDKLENTNKYIHRKWRNYNKFKDINKITEKKNQSDQVCVYCGSENVLWEIKNEKKRESNKGNEKKLFIER